MCFTHLGLKRVVLLAQVLLPEVVWVESPPVSPLKVLGTGDVDVLEVLVVGVPGTGVGRNLKI